jgi:hypothetical protein
MRVAVVLCLACAGCLGGAAADLSSVSVGLVAASSIAHAASLAAAATGGPTVCASVTSCAAYPCRGTTSLTLGAGCPLPLGGAGSGTVVVMGTWSAAGQGTVSETFVGDGVADGRIALAQAVGVSVKSANGMLTVAYAGQDVSVSSGATLAAQSAWTVTVDTRGTADPSDDVYDVTGSQQGASSSGGGQVAITGAVLDPACRKNPIAGSAIIQQVGSASIQEDSITFHAACDGNADVVGTLGGKSSAPLHLFSR